jgi:predicted ester cyclase
MAMTEQEDNRRRLRQLLVDVDEGRLDAVLAAYDPAYRDHDASESRRGSDSGVAALDVAFRLFYAAFSDVRHTVDDIVAEGDRVAARISVEARHTGEIHGVPATGITIRNDSIAMYRFRNGRIVERWCRERQSTRALLDAAARAVAATSTE